MLGSWATAHPPALGHDTMVCIVKGMAGCTAKGVTIRPGLGHDTAEHEPQYGVQCARYGRQRARGLVGGECRDTKLCIVTGARAWPLVCHDTVFVS